jgi:hypothetical protein
MSRWPQIDYGHTDYETAVSRGDVYGIGSNASRAAKRPLRVAIAGCGGVALAKWLPAIQYLRARSEPVALCGVIDPSQVACDKVAALYNAPGHASIDSLLAQERPDLILIACSNNACSDRARCDSGGRARSRGKAFVHHRGRVSRAVRLCRKSECHAGQRRQQAIFAAL